MIDRSAQQKALLILFLSLFALSFAGERLFPALSLLTERGEARSVPPAVVPDHGEGRLVMGVPIEINSATADDLAALPGIGPTIAGRIVAMRSEAGPFPSPEALRKVKGVGPKKLDAVRHLIVCKVAAARH